MATLPPSLRRKIADKPLSTPAGRSPLAVDEVVIVDNYSSSLAAPEESTSPIALPRARSTATLPVLTRVHTTPPVDSDDFEDETPIQAIHGKTPGGLVERPASSKKRKLKRPPRFTKQDAQILTAADWMGRATATHLAFAVNNVPNNLHARLRKLVQQGFLMENANETMKQYGITDKGLAYIGVPVRAMHEPSRSTMAHRNKLNTVVTYFKIGGVEFQRLLRKDAVNNANGVESKNRGALDYNAMLAEKQSAILAKPEQSRTEQERSMLKRRPRTLKEVPAIPDEMYGESQYMTHPQVAEAERVILRDIAAHGELACARDWEREVDAFMSYPGFPVRSLDDRRTVSEEERAVMQQAIEGKMWMFRHWNTDKKFEKKHTPDGVLLLPHVLDADGTLHPGSYWIELEDTRKKLPEVIRACEQAMDAPNVRGVVYYTDDQAVANLVKRAKEDIAGRLAASLLLKGIGSERAKEQAEKVVRDAIRLTTNVPVMNRAKNASGFWG